MFRGAGSFERGESPGLPRSEKLPIQKKKKMDMGNYSSVVI